MRITDPGEEAGPVNSFRKPDILSSIRTQSRALPADSAPKIQEDNFDEDTGKITADVQSARLKQLLGKIKTNT